MEYNTVIFEKENGIATITLNKPKSMNSISNELMSELDGVLDLIAADNEIAVVIITGNEKVFAAGADIKEISQINTPVKAHAFVETIQSLFNKLERLPQPVIAAVSGLALGGGCEMCMACDIRIAADNALFGQPEIKIGVIPGAGGTQRLPRLVGVGRAKELLYTGDPIKAEEACRIGLVNKVVPLATLMDEARAMASKIAKQPGYALKMTKIVVNDGINMDLRSANAYESRSFEQLFATEDQQEGMKAFIEKRKAVFTGK
ncbi:MAG: enoyl-CoA hydratase/isomerase family protein [Deltaproteobacteria bacterium]|nr:enoyl-CoA hydratase/isomerase family protein [Deltaproteobacteria bacterium]